MPPTESHSDSGRVWPSEVDVQALLHTLDQIHPYEPMPRGNIRDAVRPHRKRSRLVSLVQRGLGSDSEALSLKVNRTRTPLKLPALIFQGQRNADSARYAFGSSAFGPLVCVHKRLPEPDGLSPDSFMLGPHRVEVNTDGVPRGIACAQK